ncbi:MAG: 4-hydroxythreonine-4-phosphate dehydrogenase PdxA [Deltaproteobacteria bacterium]|nr:4-hydroxythreonine-4-phosphate dehydrogenase PdxA [Deltaproteobacteria bacterium]
MGDPAGIGPEIALRACLSRQLGRRARFVLVGDAGVFADTARRLRLGRAWAARRRPLPVEEVSALAAIERRPGAACGPGAEAAYRAILRAVDLVRGGGADGVVTAPVAKHAIQALGYDFPGHTELIARLAGDAEVRMMMAGPSLRVVLVTTHIPLRDVPAAVTAERVARTAEIARTALRRHFRIHRPRLALAGLNPHAGESGAFGDEEQRVLAPAVRAARERGVALDGPHPPDSVFFRARAGEFDAVIALYHDQGLIPFKLLHFHDGVNVTIGLPFPRTSPDHGTAFDIAGRGRADVSSMASAIRMAADMARRGAAGR